LSTILSLYLSSWVLTAESLAIHGGRRSGVRAVAGVDIGATKVAVGLVSLSGDIVLVESTSTPQWGDSSTIALLVVSLIRNLLLRVGATLVAVGVGTIGPLDIRKGDVVGTPNVRLRSFKVREPLQRELGVDVYVVNDCVAAVWGEYRAGAGVGHRNVVYVTLSTGIGCGAVVDDHLLLGKDGNAHEVGHIVLDTSGRFTCGCGGLGHWEGISSGANIPRTAKILAEEWGGPRTESLEKSLTGGISPEELFRYWKLGDPFADYLVNFLAEINAAGLASVINVYDPEVLTLGGSISLRNPDFANLTFSKVGKYLINRPPRMLLTPLGDLVVVVGAAMIAIKTPENLLRIQKAGQ